MATIFSHLLYSRIVPIQIIVISESVKVHLETLDKEALNRFNLRANSRKLKRLWGKRAGMSVKINQHGVCVVEDDRLVRKGLTSLLEQQGLSVQEFSTGHEFREKTASLTCSCALLDINLPDMNGLDILDMLRTHRPEITVIIITGQGDIPTAVKAMQHGAVDFIEKPPTAQRLREAIDRALIRNNQEDQDRPGVTGKLRPPLDKLSQRELEVLVHLIEGDQHKVIARKLGISHRTVEVHRARIMNCCGAQSFAELVRIAVRSGLHVG